MSNSYMYLLSILIKILKLSLLKLIKKKIFIKKIQNYFFQKMSKEKYNLTYKKAKKTVILTTHLYLNV